MEEKANDKLNKDVMVLADSSLDKVAGGGEATWGDSNGVLGGSNDDGLPEGDINPGRPEPMRVIGPVFF